MAKITLTPEEFRMLAKTMSQEALFTFITERYSNGYLDREIVSCEYITKAMIQKLFAEKLPYQPYSIGVFLEKCSADELIEAVITKARSDGLCWEQSVRNREELTLQILSKIVDIGWGPGGHILEAFIKSKLVQVKDVQLLFEKYSQNLLTVYSMIQITQSLQAKYPIEKLLEYYTAEGVQMLKNSIKRGSLEGILSVILEAKETDALAISPDSLSLKRVTFDIDKTSPVYSGESHSSDSLDIPVIGVVVLDGDLGS